MCHFRTVSTEFFEFDKTYGEKTHKNSILKAYYTEKYKIFEKKNLGGGVLSYNRGALL